MAQIKGLVGRAVDGMVRRSVRHRFHSVHWVPPAEAVQGPVILTANHHGWHDGHLMYLASTALGIEVVDWIEEYDAFPLFGQIGGLPFPNDRPEIRAATIRKTIRGMREGRFSLILFAEGVLHRPPELLTFGRALETVVKNVPQCQVIPVGIRYEYAKHERPEAFLEFGAPLTYSPEIAYQSRLAVKALLDRLAVRILFEPETIKKLAEGTPDVNEKWDMRALPGTRSAK